MKRLGITNFLGILSGVCGIVCYFIEDIITGTFADELLIISKICLGIFAAWFTFKLWIITQKSEE